MTITTKKRGEGEQNDNIEDEGGRKSSEKYRQLLVVTPGGVWGVRLRYGDEGSGANEEGVRYGLYR